MRSAQLSTRRTQPTAGRGRVVQRGVVRAPSARGTLGGACARPSTPAFPRPTHRTTSSASAAGRSCRGWRAGVGREPGDVDVILPYDEVVDALGLRRGALRRPADGRRSTRSSAPSTAPRASTASSAPPPRACARAGSGSPTPCAAASRCRRSRSSGSARSTSCATATTACRWPARSGARTIDAYVVEVDTRVGAERSLRVDDLPQKSHERLFHERVPLPSRARGRIARHRRVGLRRAGRGRRGVGLPARCRTAPSSSTAPPPRGCGSTRSTSRSSRCCARPTWSATATETDAYLRVVQASATPHAHARLERGRARPRARGRGAGAGSRARGRSRRLGRSSRVGSADVSGARVSEAPSEGSKRCSFVDVRATACCARRP